MNDCARRIAEWTGLAIIVGLLPLTANCVPGADSENQMQEQGRTKEQLARDRIGGKVLIILAKPLDRESKSIHIQDYILDGQPYIPFFGSEEDFRKSAPTNLENPVISIDRRLFLSVLERDRILIFNPTLSTEMRFTGAELQTLFPEPFPYEEISDREEDPGAGPSIP